VAGSASTLTMLTVQSSHISNAILLFGILRKENEFNCFTIKERTFYGHVFDYKNEERVSSYT
jgi:hypothetical protein